jgi:hypothetical protein
MSSFRRVDRHVGEKLSELYKDNLKHGDYQPAPDYLLPFISHSKLNPLWRDPRPRLVPVLKELVDLPDSIVVEIGANSGYQSLELARAFPRHKIVAIEGSYSHSEFIKACADIEELENLSVVNSYITPRDVVYDFQEPIVLDFNVAHHLGSDLKNFGVSDTSTWWSSGIGEWLKGAERAAQYWFQCGFRLGGEKHRNLHDIGDPRGFVLKIIERSPFEIEEIRNLWYFMRTPHQKMTEEVLLAAENCNMEELNKKIGEASDSGDFVGEYFRRPLLQVVPKG